MDQARPGAGKPPHTAPHPSEIVDLERRLAFLELTENDKQRLRTMSSDLTACAPAFVDSFYRHLFAFDETRRFLEDPELVARLKLAQQAHLTSMLEADWCEEYLERRFRVGDVHAQRGISPQIFLGAYNQYLQSCIRHLAAAGGDVCDYAEQVLSLQKAVIFDIGLTLEAYFTQATQSLHQALELVYQANAELRQFAQLTSHDLKTPLATMANLCDEAIDEFGDQMPPEAVKLVESARNRAFRMSTTIDELLSSTISLHQDVDQQKVSSDQVIGEAAEQVRPLLKQKRIELTVQPNSPRVWGDRARLREVFYNLLSNAVKFSDKRPGKIEVSFTVRDRECIFCVADNGSGIPAEELARVFVPFRRLAAHRDIPGSGLGLYFAKTIVEQQQGQIWVESEVGHGSRFHVLLKLADPLAENGPAVAGKPPARKSK